MAELALRQESPLVAAKQLQQSNAQPAVAGVKLGEQPLLGYLNLRGQGDGFADAVQQSIGLTLPTTANTLSENDDHVLCWLGPDEWLLMVPPGDQDALAHDGHSKLTLRSSPESGCASARMARACASSRCQIIQAPRRKSALSSLRSSGAAVHDGAEDKAPDHGVLCAQPPPQSPQSPLPSQASQGQTDPQAHVEALAWTA